MQRNGTKLNELAWAIVQTEGIAIGFRLLDSNVAQCWIRGDGVLQFKTLVPFHATSHHYLLHAVWRQIK